MIMKVRNLGLAAMVAAVIAIIGCGGGGGGGTALAPIGGGGGGTGGGGGAGGGTILGQVTNNGGLAQAKLQRLNFANLRALVQDTDLSAPVNTDGTFRLDNVPPGRQVVQIDDSSGGVGGVVTVNVGTGRTTSTGAIVPQPVGRITGSIFSVTDGGQVLALAGARIEAMPLEATTEILGEVANGRPRFVGRSDPNGEYNIRGVIPGTYLLVARARGFFEGTQAVDVAERQTVAADFALEPQPREAGTVRATARTTQDGQTVPLRDVLVALRFERPRPGPGGNGGGGDAPPPPPESFTIGQLNGQLPPVPNGLNAPGLRTHRQVVGGGPGGGGRPLERPIFGMTNGDGSVELNAVPSGRYVAFFLREGYAVEQRPLEVRTGETTTVEVTLRSNTGQVSGTVTDRATRRPIPNAGVLVFRDDPFILPLNGGPNGGGGIHAQAAMPNAQGLSIAPPVRFFALTDGRGQFELTAEAGRQTVIAFAENYREAFQSVNVQVGQTATVTLQLDAAPPGEVTIMGALGRHLNQRRQ